MSDKLKLILGGILFAVVVILFETMFIINQTEQAIVLQFGEPVREIKQAGLKFKIPFIQKVVIYDNRLLNLEPPAQEVVLNDKKRLDVDVDKRKITLKETIKAYGKYSVEVKILADITAKFVVYVHG